MQIPGEQITSKQIEEEIILNFRGGIPGFEQYTKYAIYAYDDTFSFLQSVENENIAFIIVDPFIFFQEYEFVLPDAEIEELEIKGLDDVIIRSIVTWGEALTSVTANLMAPLVINHKNRCAKQVVLYPTEYQSKHPLVRVKSEPEGRRS